ncbi:MAG: hypothetical protein ACR2RA_25425 [Geminicoccaceae bacterium]
MRRFFAIALSVVLWPSLLCAQTIGDADAIPPAEPSTLPYGLFVSPTISTLGLGIEGGMRVNETFGFRLGGNWLGFEVDDVENDFDYEADATVASLGALVDYFPFRGGFRVSGGLRLNFNGGDLTGTARDDIEVGDVEFAPGEIGTIEGDVSYDLLAPYLGIGYGATLLEGAFSIGFDLGVMYHGQADIELDSEGGSLSGSAVLNENLAIEEDRAEDDLKNFFLYPVIGLAANYRF